jgi:NADH:ubiquinone oxidoreductase subunit D
MEEMGQSLRIIEQALDRLPEDRCRPALKTVKLPPGDIAMPSKRRAVGLPSG